MKKSKKWIDMDANELKKEVKPFKWITLFLVILTIITLILAFYEKSYVMLLLCIIILIMSVFSLSIMLHLDQLFVIKKMLEEIKI